MMRVRKQVVIPHNPDIKLESLAVSKDYLTVFSRWQGIQRPTFYAITQAAGSPPTIFDSTTIAFEEAAYTLECGHQVIQHLQELVVEENVVYNRRLLNVEGGL